MKKLKKVLLILLVLLVLGGAAVIGLMYKYYGDILADPLAILRQTFSDTDGDGRQDVPVITYKGQRYAYNQNIITLVLIGIDQSDSEERAELRSARSDMMVVCAIDATSQTAKMIVVPRDTRAKVRSVDKNGKVTDDSYNKINASFPFGQGNVDKNKGAQNVMFNLERLLTRNGKYQAPLTKYGGINMDGIGPLTKAVGGVKVTLNQTINGVGKKGETVTLNAEKAEKFCVARHNVGDGSDLQRGQRQIQYMLGLASRIKEMNVTDIPGVYSKVSQNAFTNLKTDEMIAFATYLKGIKMGDITFTQLAGNAKNMDGKSYYIVDEDKMEELIVNTFYTKI